MEFAEQVARAREQHEGVGCLVCQTLDDVARDLLLVLWDLDARPAEAWASLSDEFVMLVVRLDDDATLEYWLPRPRATCDVDRILDEVQRLFATRRH